eukprot:scaffold1596_cov302-Pinguiococcus_pyrenoidosus.AAC.3
MLLSRPEPSAAHSREIHLERRVPPTVLPDLNHWTQAIVEHASFGGCGFRLEEHAHTSSTPKHTEGALSVDELVEVFGKVFRRVHQGATFSFVRRWGRL